MSKTPNSNRETFTDIVLAIHGGAGVLRREVINRDAEQQYLFHLASALEAGYKLLSRGRTALDGVEAAVRYLEDCPLFNAGKGSVLNEQGVAELDAAIMDGRTRAAGAVASVTCIRNPILAARAVMERSEHVLLAGQGAEEFADNMGLEKVDPSYFITERQAEQLNEHRRQQKLDAPRGHQPNHAPVLSKYGTVGAVAVDSERNLAAATSTGGTINKLRGRIGDSPLIGAGTYAENDTCAVSGTGHGEYFIRWVAAYDVSALMKYARLTLQEAANQVIHETLQPVNGQGGLIAIDADGNCALPYNSEGMFRGCVTKSGDIHVAIFSD